MQNIIPINKFFLSRRAASCFEAAFFVLWDAATNSTMFENGKLTQEVNTFVTFE
jgi:hypothetical protein